MAKFKRFLSVVLCVCLIASTATIFGSAASSDAKSTLPETNDEQLPIIFVTGIGQSYSYFYESVDDAKEYYTLLEQAKKDPSIIETDGSKTRWNLFCNDFSFAFKEVGTYFAIIPVVFGLLGSVCGINLIPEKCVDKIITTLFRYNLIDEKGQLPENVITPRCPYPVSQYTTEQRSNFYRSIPCKDFVGDIGEDNLYCYNYSAFSFTYDNAAGLDDFIENAVLPQTGKDKVVLIPMSMGASVVSMYLQEYGTKGRVERVVSIVGAWDGSDVFADLIECKFAPDAPEKLYNGVLANLIGEPWGYLVNGVIRIFPKKTLRSIIDEILGSLVDNFVMKTPSLLALVPHDRYPAIRAAKLEGHDDLAYIMEMTDHYYEWQKDLENNLKKLNEDVGTEFYYIAGYDLGFGGYFETDYEFFRFFNSADITNSDEIIQISSTATGATYVTPGQKVEAKGDAKYVSPDGSVDLSTCYFPDHVWLFEGQKHELENNNIALRLALDLANGKITSVDDENNIYPRFNSDRNLKKLNRDYLPAFYAYVAAKAVEKLTAEQQKVVADFKADSKNADNNNALYNLLVELGVYADGARKPDASDMNDDLNTYLGSTYAKDYVTDEQYSKYKDVLDMKERVVADFDADKEVIDAFYDMIASLGIKEPRAEESEPSTITKIFSAMNDATYKVFGAKGFVDIFGTIFKKIFGIKN